MFLRDVITQLRTELPKNSDNFSEKIAISTITHVAGLVTVVTASSHGLSTGDFTTIVGAKQKTPITTLTRSGSIVTMITTIDHDQTMDFESISDQPDIVITDCSVVAYNSNFKPLDVASRRKLTFTISGTPANAIDGNIIENSVNGFSGLKIITKVNATTFTFTTTKPLATTGFGGFVHTTIRVAATVNFERVLTAYSKHSSGNWWAFIVPGDTTSSKDRHTLSDSTYTPTKGDEYRQKIITPFNIYITVPSKNDIAGRASYDEVITESVALFKSVLGFAVPSPYTIESFSKIILEGHGPETFLKAYYVHRFEFSITDNIIIDDTNTTSEDIAFRDIDFDITNSFDEIIMDNTLKTDEE